MVTHLGEIAHNVTPNVISFSKDIEEESGDLLLLVNCLLFEIQFCKEAQVSAVLLRVG